MESEDTRQVLQEQQRLGGTDKGGWEEVAHGEEEGGKDTWNMEK